MAGAATAKRRSAQAAEESAEVPVDAATDPRLSTFDRRAREVIAREIGKDGVLRGAADVLADRLGIEPRGARRILGRLYRCGYIGPARRS